LGHELGTLLLEKLTIRIVVLKRDAILLHHVVVKELSGCVYGEAPTIGHTKSLRHFVNITSEINLSIGNCFHPRFKTLLSEFFDKRFTFVSQINIKDIRLLCVRHTNLRIFVDVLVDDVIGESNLLQGLCTSDDNLSRTEDTARDFLHVMGGFELDLDSRISVRFKRNFENIVVLFEPICHFHEVDVVVETKVTVDHDHPKRVFGKIDF
jgi:hypothetical protein